MTIFDWPVRFKRDTNSRFVGSTAWTTLFRDMIDVIPQPKRPDNGGGFLAAVLTFSPIAALIRAGWIGF